ncbi:PREDICTED: uncharacterized protein LOC105359175 isoform X1 [Ceratosolen solmsi marchali]|uniref:Uncharacterized protein LOC105359175 isoform X1 n=1 Tax=Ceratosolen solmsi marchali TaxID=326594 RepID=A0AAJ6VJ56_9HYME|nr:PREDICTED: uncharacterized protein LOC105359175 isoform X1 [Ceratosolen solmsi marchali]XP_011493983.1 PREDICTED: uncharacterized protein LOC105359175 isoform X1 [Ceratosolen solmsi marchali]XP_011493984.1 PREDICTED: uncharacterized protein LOC105359175 isoform X1 [Ceratosolen solmsi marchali]
MKPRFTVALLMSVTILVTVTIEGRPSVNQEPIKFSLDIKKDDEEKITEKPRNFELNAKIQDGMEWLSRMADTLRFGRGRLVNSVAIARNAVAERFEEIMSETRNNVAGAIGAANDIIVKGRSTLQSYEKSPFANFLPPKTRETTRLESEKDQAFFERKRENPISLFLQSILKPQPIVDSIKEEDKYGNNGDKFVVVGRAFVNGVEGISNFVNYVADLPVNAAKKTSRGITEALNQIGSRLIGLQ